MKSVVLRTLVIWLVPALLAFGCSASTPQGASAPSDEPTRGAEEREETTPTLDTEKPAPQPTTTEELTPEESKVEEGKDSDDKDDDSVASPKKKSKSKTTSTDEKEFDDEIGEEGEDSEDGDNAYIDPVLP